MVVTNRLTDDEIRRLRALVEVRGVDATAERFGLSAHSMCRALAGLPVRMATVTVIRIQIANAA